MVAFTQFYLTKHEQGQMNDPKHRPELRRSGSLQGRLDGVESGLEGGAETH